MTGTSRRGFFGAVARMAAGAAAFVAVDGAQPTQTQAAPSAPVAPVREVVASRYCAFTAGRLVHNMAPPSYVRVAMDGPGQELSRDTVTYGEDPPVYKDDVTHGGRPGHLHFRHAGRKYMLPYAWPD